MTYDPTKAFVGPNNTLSDWLLSLFFIFSSVRTNWISSPQPLCLPLNTSNQRSSLHHFPHPNLTEISLVGQPSHGAIQEKGFWEINSILAKLTNFKTTVDHLTIVPSLKFSPPLASWYHSLQVFLWIASVTLLLLAVFFPGFKCVILSHFCFILYKFSLTSFVHFMVSTTIWWWLPIPFQSIPLLETPEKIFICLSLDISFVYP